MSVYHTNCNIYVAMNAVRHLGITGILGVYEELLQKSVVLCTKQDGYKDGYICK